MEGDRERDEMPSTSSDGRPPLSRPMHARHSSFIRPTESNLASPEHVGESCGNNFVPVIRSGGCADIGRKHRMEDVHICCDDLTKDYGLKNFEEPTAFYGVFDGHEGKHAADFACSNLLKYIIESEDFPKDIEKVISSAFHQTDSAFAEACSGNRSLASGTTALVALLVENSLIVANAGDCRAVLCRRGKAIELSRDHKPSCTRERLRIEELGGYVCHDGYLNGDLGVARALGDWHIDGLKGPHGPLIAEPEFTITRLTEEDEFLIMGCDGLWDVFRSQSAIAFARRKLQEHNDPAKCCKELVDKALKMGSRDNLTVVVVCFSQNPPPILAFHRPWVSRSISAEGLREIQSYL